MSKYRFCYAKEDSVKYVSHLDFIRTVERAMKRAHLPVSHSQGFNPHPQMAVAVPLSVGMTSSGELMDIGFDEDLTPDELLKRMNEALPEGFRILQVKSIEKENLAKLKYIDTAEYHIYTEFHGSLPDILAFMNCEEVIVSKKSKKNTADTNIRPLIHDIKIVQADKTSAVFYTKMAAGQINVKPMLLIDALCKYQPEFKGEYLSARRLSLLSSQEICF